MNPKKDEQRHRPPLDHVLTVLNLERQDENTFIGHSLPEISGRIYGGQVMAQSIIAAGSTLVDDGDGPRRVHSFHCYFLRPGDLNVPVTLSVERLHDGRSFSTRRTHAIQNGRPILSMILSFQEEQEGVDHYVRMPRVPTPDELRSGNDVYARLDDELASKMLRTGAFDFRHVESNLLMGVSPESQPRQAVWMRANGALPDRTGQLMHRALLAYACDQVMLEPVLRAHGLSWVSPGLKVASLDHSMWFHRPFDMRDWLLFVQSSPSAQGGRGLGEGLIFDTEGCLVASTAQEGMIRA